MAEWLTRVPISKLDDEKRLAFGWASTVTKADGSEIVDHQGTIIPEHEMESAAYGYVAEARGSSEMHERFGVATLVESIALTVEKRKAMGLPPGESAWWVGFRVDDDAVWKRLKAGELTEFSIGGTAIKEPVE